MMAKITKKENVLKELFGAIKFSKPGKELVREARKEFEKLAQVEFKKK
jgi:hypothetical protein